MIFFRLINRVKALLPFLAAVLFVIGCSSDDDNTQPTSTSFDRVALMQHYSKNIIQPNIDVFENKAEALEMTVMVLSSTPSQENLDAARLAWEEATLAYADCQSFNFGPGESLFGSFAENVATFPVNESLTNTYIQNGDTTLNNFDRNTRGIYGLEFMLYDSDALSKFNQPNYSSYSRAIVRDIVTRTSELKNGWTSYSAGFEADNGTGSSSNITLMYNEWLKGFELIKNFKVGLPAGLRVGQTGPAPEQTAARYSGLSKRVIERHLKHIEIMYWGAPLDGTPATGFDDFLASTVGGQEVLTQTEQQWAVVWEKFNALPDVPFEQMVVSNPTEVEEFYTALSQHTRFFKSELSSRIGLTITFDSGDGD